MPDELIIRLISIYKTLFINSINIDSPISFPALSPDRLEVRYGKYGSVWFFLADKAGFLAALHQPNPALRHD